MADDKPIDPRVPESPPVIRYADHDEVMRIAAKQRERWRTLLDRLAEDD